MNLKSRFYQAASGTGIMTVGTVLFAMGCVFAVMNNLLSNTSSSSWDRAQKENEELFSLAKEGSSCIAQGARRIVSAFCRQPS